MSRELALKNGRLNEKALVFSFNTLFSFGMKVITARIKFQKARLE
jgi:hypothetical protein